MNAFLADLQNLIKYPQQPTNITWNITIKSLNLSDMKPVEEEKWKLIYFYGFRISRRFDCHEERKS